MHKCNMILLLLIFYPIYLCAQQECDLIKEDRIGTDTVIREHIKRLSSISVYLKGDNETDNKCLMKVPRNMSVEEYEGKLDYYMDKYIQCKVDSLNEVFLSFFSQESLEKLLQSDSNHPLFLTFRITNNGEIYSVTAGIKKDVDKAINSGEYYKIQNLLKCNVLFIPPNAIGLTGCIRFTLPIKKNQIEREISKMNKS